MTSAEIRRIHGGWCDVCGGDPAFIWGSDGAMTRYACREHLPVFLLDELLDVPRGFWMHAIVAFEPTWKVGRRIVHAIEDVIPSL